MVLLPRSQFAGVGSVKKTKQKTTAHHAHGASATGQIYKYFEELPRVRHYAAVHKVNLLPFMVRADTETVEVTPPPLDLMSCL